MNTKIEAEVRRAYADCWMKDWVRASKIRNLSFRASEPVTVEDAIDIFYGMSTEFSYNEFTPDLLEELGNDTLIYIAREGSVCVYVVTERLPRTIKSMQRSMKADEFDSYGEMFRIWWD